jgi:hemerythrin superfamily protein
MRRTRRDILHLVVEDHRTTEEHLYDVVAARRVERGENFALLRSDLERHWTAEEAVVYPLVRRAGGEAASQAERGGSAHADTGRLVAELGTLDPQGDDFAGRLLTLTTVFTDHVHHEEDELLPVLADLGGPDRLEALGRTYRAARAAIRPRIPVAGSAPFDALAEPVAVPGAPLAWW